MPEFRCQGVARNLRQGTGEFDAGRAAADNRESQPRLATLRIRLQFGAFKCGQDLRANGQRVIQGLQAARMFGPIIVTKVGMGRAGGDDEIVVLKGLLAQVHALRREIDRLHLAHQHRSIRLATQDMSQRRRNRGCRQSRRSHLVQQRLKQVVVAAVDQRDVHVRRTQRPNGPQSAEATAHDYDSFAGWHFLSIALQIVGTAPGESVR